MKPKEYLVLFALAALWGASSSSYAPPLLSEHGQSRQLSLQPDALNRGEPEQRAVTKIGGLPY